MMKWFSKSRFWVYLLAVVTILLANRTVSANNESLQFAESVNLAARRTSHIILNENGDSTSVIQPVVQTDLNTFVIRLNHVFSYSKLPDVLQQSFDMYGIKRGYHVAVMDCDSGIVLLGYNFLDLRRPEGVPCGTRAEKEGCRVIKIVFEPEKQIAAATSGWWIIPFGSMALLAGFMFWKRSKRPTIEEPLAASSPDIFALRFGLSSLDSRNLTLTCGTVVHQLTYREAKLLKLFASHLNQVLERDRILKSVWEDEGIIVGRSLDVFVSRLRKMLQEDAQVKITAVHGVGYRMEVTP